MSDKKAEIIEIFSSFQGEGPYLGFRQIFLRFSGCNLNCAYCDTGFKVPPEARVEQTPGQQDFEAVSNQLDADAIFYYIKKLDNPKGLHHSISLTGGEPLLQADFLKEFLTENHVKYKYKIYLETNGILPDELNKIVQLVDIVSMDIKLPTSTKDKVEHWHEHKKFLEVLNENKKSKIEYFVKVVVTNDMTDYELYNIVWCVSNQEVAPLLVLQPESTNPPEGQKLLDWQQRLLKQLPDVRIIPQMHKKLAVM